MEGRARTKSGYNTGRILGSWKADMKVAQKEGRQGGWIDAWQA
jgi:hypothetical protein